MFLALLFSCNSGKNIIKKDIQSQLISLESGFINPPDSVQTSVYWYWMSDNISKEGVVKDLQSMKKVGINRAFIGNIGYESTPYGKVKLFSDEWWDILHTALKTATELNIEIGIFNSPGWSQSGGPWIKPSQSMRYLSSSETSVKGPKNLNIKLDKPGPEFQDVRVIAFKAPEKYGSTLADFNPKLRASQPVENLENLIDGNQETVVPLPAGTSLALDIETKENFTARSFVIHPEHKKLRANAEIQVKENNSYRTIRSFEINRSNDNLNVGFDPYGPIAISIPPTTSKNFRIVFSKATPNFGIAELQVSSSPAVESFTEKTLAKMFQTPLPYWN
ncbi:MAG: glycoside hydrolase family 2, partial [Opitutaceae bacterium]|nr:glycoside hydrolase family 2 [Cytophagales bacterium]